MAYHVDEARERVLLEILGQHAVVRRAVGDDYAVRAGCDGRKIGGGAVLRDAPDRHEEALEVLDVVARGGGIGEHYDTGAGGVCLLAQRVELGC